VFEVSTWAKLAELKVIRSSRAIMGLRMILGSQSRPGLSRLLSEQRFRPGWSPLPGCRRQRRWPSLCVGLGCARRAGLYQAHLRGHIPCAGPCMRGAGAPLPRPHLHTRILGHAALFCCMLASPYSCTGWPSRQMGAPSSRPVASTCDSGHLNPLPSAPSLPQALPAPPLPRPPSSRRVACRPAVRPPTLSSGMRVWQHSFKKGNILTLEPISRCSHTCAFVR